MRKKKFKAAVVSIFVGLSMSLLGINAAKAAISYSFVSPYDSYTPTNLSSSYDAQYIQVVRDSADPSGITFVVYFAKAITADIYKYQNGKTPFGAVLIYRTDPGSTYGGDKRDIAIFSSSLAFVGNQELSASVNGNSKIGGTKSSISGCNARSWTDLNSSARWIAFKVNKNCAYIPDQFWLQFYSDENEAAGSNRTAYDWVGNSAIYIDVTRTSLVNAPYESPFTVNGIQPSPTPTPTPTPTIQKRIQTISGFENKLYPLSLGALDLPRFSDQGLNVYWKSTNEDVCYVNRFSYEVILEGVGSCSLVATADGNDFYYPQTASFYLPIWDDSADIATIKPTPSKKPTARPTAKPTPKKTISGSASAKKKASPSSKATVSGKIGGTASGRN